MALPINLVISADDTDGFTYVFADSTLTLNETITLSNVGLALDATNAADNRFINVKGTINAVESAANADDGDGIEINGASSQVLIASTGRVDVADDGITVFGIDSDVTVAGVVKAGQTGVTLVGDDIDLVVTGKIISATTAILMGADSENQRTTNSGKVTGELAGFDILGSGTFINQQTGVVTGPDNFGSDERQTIVNRGTINGDIFLKGDDDTFDGRGGTLDGRVLGGKGNDIYIIDDVDTRIVEFSGVDTGFDEVHTSKTFTLGNNLEILFLLGGQDRNGFGNGLDNFLLGNSGDNRLEGKGGNDFFRGSQGADSFFGGAGQDVVEYGDSLHGVTINLDANKAKGSNATGDHFAGIEDIVGSNFDDRLIGNDAKNILTGFLGDDILTGGKGRDTFEIFGILGQGGNDTITDFEDGKDKIDLRGVAGADSFDLIKEFITEKKGNTIIDLDSFSEDQQLVIEGKEASGFGAPDFIF